ncbi:MAG: alpha/beta hydrolase [Dechloromonas sp.]|nr:alpha/beta hydrolase [Dechloromonas sp.]
MQALFIHGMGRSPLSGWPLLRQLQRAGLKTATFGYFVSLDDFSSITARLVARIEQLAARGEYILIGHSLGGVLLRAALSALPPGVTKPQHVFLLGSPMRPARLAQRLRDRLLYRLATRDCGQLLGSAERMQEIAALAAPTTVVIGIRGLPGSHGPFGNEENDGVVAASEVAAHGNADEVRVPVVHTLLPSSRLVTAVILYRLAPDRGAPSTASGLPAD